MAKVRLLHGKPLMVGGKVALSDDCCCGAQPPGVCPDTETITITFSLIENCPVIIIGDFNGVFVLTQTFPGSGIWEGAGADYDAGLGITPTTVTFSCSSEFGISIDYRDSITGAAVVFVTGFIFPIPSPLTNIPNNITDCDSTIAKNGTATIT